MERWPETLIEWTPDRDDQPTFNAVIIYQDGPTVAEGVSGDKHARHRLRSSALGEYSECVSGKETGRELHLCSDRNSGPTVWNVLHQNGSTSGRGEQSTPSHDYRRGLQSGVAVKR